MRLAFQCLMKNVHIDTSNEKTLDFLYWRSNELVIDVFFHDVK